MVQAKPRLCLINAAKPSQVNAIGGQIEPIEDYKREKCRARDIGPPIAANVCGGDLFMTGRRIVGILLLVAGVVVLALGGVFWTDRDTVVDAGPLQIQTENREGIAVPPLVGGALLVGGVLLLVLPDRRRV